MQFRYFARSEIMSTRSHVTYHSDIVNQLGASLMEYEAFFPVHPSTQYCDDSAMNMDTMLARISSGAAMLFFLPLLHTLLRTFVPGIPIGKPLIVPIRLLKLR